MRARSRRSLAQKTEHAWHDLVEVLQRDLLCAAKRSRATRGVESASRRCEQRRASEALEPALTTVKQHAHVPLTAVFLIVCASACFTTVDTSVKLLSQRYPVPLIVWARWGVQTLVILAILGPRMRTSLLRTKRLPL